MASRPPGVTIRSIRRSVAAVGCLALLFLATACEDQAPIRIGFLGGITGRGADIGKASRNALQMAIEERNAAGGIKGRKLEMIVRDDANDPAQAAIATTELIDLNVDAIVGPNVSAMAAVALPLIEQAEILTVSPTVSSSAFVGLDDHFIRINSSTTDNAHAYADQMAATGYRRIAAALDRNNLIFAEKWLEEFRVRIAVSGGEVLIAETFDSNSTKAEDAPAATIARLLARKPDVLLFLANGVDTAQLAQQARKQSQIIPLVAAEWAASEELIQLGGKAIDGLEVVQSYDRGDRSPRYREFANTYRANFRSDPGYSAVAAYDAAVLLFAALEQREAGQSLKEAILSVGEVPGLQQPIAVDRFGDGRRRAYFMVIRGGQFVSKQ